MKYTQARELVEAALEIILNEGMMPRDNSKSKEHIMPSGRKPPSPAPATDAERRERQERARQWEAERQERQERARQWVADFSRENRARRASAVNEDRGHYILNKGWY